MDIDKLLADSSEDSEETVATKETVSSEEPVGTKAVATIGKKETKPKKKKVIAKNCCPNTIVNDGGRICGDYIYANTGKVSDTGAYEVWVWKFQKDGSLKRIKKLGDHVQTIIIDGKKIIYSYHKTSSQKTMRVYSCNFSGAGKKKLFTISSSKFSINSPYVFCIFAGKKLLSNFTP